MNVRNVLEIMVLRKGEIMNCNHVSFTKENSGCYWICNNNLCFLTDSEYNSLR